MQALKTLVAAMGLLIVLGSCVLVWGLYQKATDPNFKLFSFSLGKSEPAVPAAVATTATPATVETPAAPAMPRQAFANVDLNLPTTCEIAGMEVSNGRLFLRISGGETCDRIIAIDAADGHVLGTISARK